jgi:hypothetical protein
MRDIDSGEQIRDIDSEPTDANLEVWTIPCGTLSPTFDRRPLRIDQQVISSFSW